MKIEDLLKRLGLQDPNAVAKNFNLMPPIPDCKIGFLIPLIVRHLTNPIEIEKIRISENAMNAMEAHLIKGDEIAIEQKRVLEKYGFIIDDVIPDEIEAYFKPRWLQKYIIELPAQMNPITASAFLKLYLLIEYLERNGSIKLHNKRNGKTFANQYHKLNNQLMIWRNRDILLGIIDYLKGIKLVDWLKNVMSPNLSNIAVWRKEEQHQVLKRFYEKMFVQQRAYELPELIKDISNAGARDMKWASWRFFKKERLKNVNTGVQLGLIRAIKNDDDILLQLTPEGSFYANGEVPSYWQENNMIITADYDLHIPYNHDPFLIATLYSKLEMVNNEFFIIFKAEPEKIQNKREFLTILETYCRRIPDVVRYEFG